MSQRVNVFSRLFIAIAAKRFNKIEKIILLCAALGLIVAGHIGVQRWTAQVARQQVVVEPLIPPDSMALPAPLPGAGQVQAALPGPVIPQSPARVRRDPFLPSRNPKRQIKTVEPPKPTINLTVNGILWDDKTPTAIINSKVVGIGDIIFGKAIVDIEKDRVMVMEDGAIQTLYFKK